MAYEDGYFQVGSVKSPLEITANSLLEDADPAIHKILNYLSAVLTSHLKDRWNLEVGKADRLDLEDKVVSLVVPYDPVPFMQDTQFSLPMLAMFRVSESYEWKTTSWYHITCKVQIQWSLPPLSASQTEVMNPFLAHASRIIVDKTAMTVDPSYTGSPFADSNIESFRVLGCKYGNIPDANTNLLMPTLVVDAEVVERRMIRADIYEPLTGVDNDVGCEN
mgnify:CR=1 FL=1